MEAKHGFDEPKSLMTTTVELLEGKDLFKVYAETGVPYYWLKKFTTGIFKNPSVNRVQYLYEHLTGTKLL